MTNWLKGHAGIGGFRTYHVRLLVQVGFALACVVGGWQFSIFIRAAQNGSHPLPVRPPGVEGFLPITGLMGLVDWIYQGTLNKVHPAATLILISFIVVSFLLRRSFCSWICPVGLLSESLARLGQRMFGRNFRLARWLDFGFRGLRYIVLAFFLWAILTMSASALRAFIESPYNRVADIKMYLFFAKISVTTVVVLAFLAVASALVNGAWCRYLCPYGALLGLVALVSPSKVRRNEEACIDCKQCDAVCMARLPVSRSVDIGGVECTGCLDCLASCPSPPALTFRALSRQVSAPVFALGVVLILFVGYSTARLSGNWRNEISDREYVERVAEIDSPAYVHPGGGSLGRGAAAAEVPTSTE